MIDEDSIQTLMRTGYAALEQENYEDAIAIGRELIAKRHSSGFEIAGLALQRKGEIGKAVELFEEGVKKAAPVWVLWKLLGDSYSDAGRFDEAENTYQTALSKTQSDFDLIHLNRGIAFHRQKKWADAEEALFRVKAARLRQRVMAELIHIAANCGKTELAAERAGALLQQRVMAEESDRKESSLIESAIALGLYHGKDFVRAKSHALLAAELNPANSEALWLIRELNGRRAQNPIGYTLILEGKLEDDVEEETPFLRTLKVAANDIDTALDYAREYFPEAIRESLRVNEVNEFDAAECTYEGGYFASDYITYPPGTE